MIVSSAVYVVPLAAFLSARPLTGAVIGGIAGGLRGATVLVSLGVTTPARLVAFHARMDAMERPVRAAALIIELALAGIATLVVAI